MQYVRLSLVDVRALTWCCVRLMWGNLRGLWKFLENVCCGFAEVVFILTAVPCKFHRFLSASRGHLNQSKDNQTKNRYTANFIRTRETLALVKRWHGRLG